MGKKRKSAGVLPAADTEQPGPSHAAEQPAADGQPRVKRQAVGKQQPGQHASEPSMGDDVAGSTERDAGPPDSTANVSSQATADDFAQGMNLVHPANGFDDGDAADVEEYESDSDYGDEEDAGHEADHGSEDSGADDESGSGDDPDRPAGAQQPHASFLQGEKGTSFAKAFAKIMTKPIKAPKAQAADAAAAPAGAVAGVPILSASKRVVDRDAAEAAEHEAKRQAKLHRLEMKQRGHMRVPKKGEDPALDAREKGLLRLATKGVVLLFNAVNKAQKSKQEALLSGKKPGRMNKASFLADLKAGSKGIVAATAAAGMGGPGSVLASAQPQEGRPAGWEVLGQGFPGLTDGSKMKDWDKAADSDEEGDAPEQLQDSDAGDDEGW